MPRKATTKRTPKRRTKRAKRSLPAGHGHPLHAYLVAHGVSYRMAGLELQTGFTNIHHICAKNQNPGPQLAMRIVKWTKGAVTFEDLYGEAK